MKLKLIFSHDTNSFVNTIDTNERCCVIFDGNHAVSPDKTECIAGRIKELIKNTGTQTKVFSVVYYPIRNEQVMNFFRPFVNSREHSANIIYRIMSKLPFMVSNFDRIGFHKNVQDLFELLILPRITDKNGNKLPVQTAKQNIRDITFVSLCYGGYILKHLLILTDKKLQKLGYSNTDKNKIMQQLVVISQSPRPSVLFNTVNYPIVNFASASDTVIPYSNVFNMSKPVQFLEKYNLIIGQSIKQNHQTTKQNALTDVEHIWWPIVYSIRLSKSGKEVVFLLRTALSNAFQLDEIKDKWTLFEYTGEDFDGLTPMQILENLKTDTNEIKVPNPQYTLSKGIAVNCIHR